MYAESQEEQESWQSYLLAATVPQQWGGVGVSEFAGRGRRGRASVDESQAAAELAAGMADLPRLRQAQAWKRRALLRRKMILCTVQFNFHNLKEHETEKEQKRLALLELIDYCDNVRGAFNDPAVSLKFYFLYYFLILLFLFFIIYFVRYLLIHSEQFLTHEYPLYVLFCPV